MNRRTFLKGTAASVVVLATAGLLTDPHSQLAHLMREGNAMRPWFAPLTARQAHVSELVALGLTNTEIAQHLGTSVRTTDAHIQNIFNKLDLHKRKQLAEWVLQSRPS
jgi:DNA-binding NarL/FixJ family response regulator